MMNDEAVGGTAEILIWSCCSAVLLIVLVVLVVRPAQRAPLIHRA